MKKEKMFRLNPPFHFEHYNSLKEFNIKKTLELFYNSHRLECSPGYY